MSRALPPVPNRNKPQGAPRAPPRAPPKKTLNAPPQKKLTDAVTEEQPQQQFDSSAETVPMEKYLELLQKYEDLCTKHTTQCSYVTALEAMVDAERKKVQQLSAGSKDKRSNTTSTKVSLPRSISKKSFFNNNTSPRDAFAPTPPANDSPVQTTSKTVRIEYQKSIEEKEKVRQETANARLANLTDKAHIHRMNILQEILNTEEDYIAVLKIIMRIQVIMIEHSFISSEENQKLFSNIRSLFPLHQTLVQDLEHCFQQATDDRCWNISVGESFLQLASGLSVYSTYINNQALQAPIVDVCSHRKPLIHKLYAEMGVFTDKKLLINQFRSFLIAPIQRICKYPLLLRELIQATDESHPDNPILVEALQQIQNATMDVNEKKKEFERIFKIQQIEESLENWKGLELLTENRIFIKEGDLLKISKGKTQERHFFLFNDLMIYGTKSLLKSGKYHVTGKIAMDKLFVNDLPDTESTKNCFEIIRMDQKKKKYIICSKFSGSQGEQDKNFWLRAIEEHADYTMKGPGQSSSNVSSNTWEPSHRTPEQLLNKFSNIVRK